MNGRTATLGELVEALNDGVAYFDIAAERSHRAACIELFQQIRRLKLSIAAELSAGALAEPAAADADGGWLEAYRRSCAGLADQLARDTESANIAALEAQERRIARAFRDAIGREREPQVRELAATYLPEVELARDHLHALRRAMVH